MERPAFLFRLLPLAMLLILPGSLARASDVAVELSLSGLPGQGFQLQSVWDPILDAHPGVQFGVKLEGPSPYERNATAPFKPASTSKLFTTAAFLERLGPTFRFETRLEWHRVEGANPERITGLKLIGSGDPSWAMQEFDETLTSRLELFARELWQRGIREIQGGIELEVTDPRWRNLRYPEGWKAEDRVACYGALAQAFNLQINCATLVVQSATNARWQEPGVPTAVSVHLRRGNRTEISVVETGEDFTLTGTWAPEPEPVTLYLPIRRMEAWVSNLFRQALARQGIRLVPKAPSSFAAETQSFTFQSPELSEILKPYLKLSLNMVGDALFKTLGSRYAPDEKDLVAAGQAVIREYVSTLGGPTALSLGIQPVTGYFRDDVRIQDGSGVSQESWVTPTALLVLLDDLARSAHFETLWEALPIAGVDGTLRTRMKDTPAEGYLRGKTGTLRDTYNLAGYVPVLNATGERTGLVPFLILTRTTAELKEEAWSAMERVGAELSRQVRKGFPLQNNAL